MRKSFLFSIGMFAAIISFAQPNPDIEWQRVLGGAGDEVAYDMINTKDGGLLLVGYTTSSVEDGGDAKHTTRGGRDYWIVKLSNAPDNPQIEWERNYGGTGEDVAFKALQEEDNGHYIVIGKTNSGKTGDINFDSIGGYDYWLIELDTAGTILRDTLFGSKFYDDYPGQTLLDDYSKIDLLRSKDGKHLLITGDVWTSEIYSSIDIWWLKLDWKTWAVVEDEKYDWNGSIPPPYYSLFSAMTGLNDGGYVICADVWNVDDKKDEFWLLKIDEAGQYLAQKNLGGFEGEYPQDILQDRDGNILVVGLSNSLDGDVAGLHRPLIGTMPAADVWLVKLDTLFNILWEKCYGSVGLDAGWSVAESGTEGYYVSGYTQPLYQPVIGDVCHVNDRREFYLLKIDQSGALEWSTSIGGGGSEKAYCVVEHNKKPVVAGFTNSNDYDVDTDQYHAGFDVWVVQFNKDCPIFPKPLIQKTMLDDSVRFEVVNTPSNQGNLYIQWFFQYKDTATLQPWILVPAKDTGMYTVRFNLDCCYSALSDTFGANYMPSVGASFVFHAHPAITPNGDGKNDILVFDGLPAENELIIYNRWSEKILENRPYLNNWNGEWKGGLLPEGDYYFRLRLFNENKIYTGLVRVMY